MAKALALLDDVKKGLPAHIQKAFGEKTNIDERSNVNALGVTGKVFEVAINGEKQKLVKIDEETGDKNPMGTIRAVILDYGKRRGRSFYEGDYDPNKTAAPICWSVDGIKPEDKVPEKQAAKCDGCPQSVKGSKTSTNGKPTVACSQHRMVALVLVGQKGLEQTPLRLKLAITSDWDGQNKEMQEDGWFAFQNYTDMLRSKGVHHTAALITKISFDPNEAYPKLIFSPDKWVSEALAEAIEPLLDSDEVKDLLNATYTPAGVDGKKTEVEAYKGKGKPAPDEEAAPLKKAKVPVEADEDEPVRTPSTKKKAPVIIDGEAEEITEAPPKKKAAPVAEEEDAPVKARRKPVEEVAEEPPAKKRKAAPVEEADEDEDDEEALLQKQLEAARARKAAAKAAEAAPAKKKAAPVAEEEDAPVKKKKTAPVEEAPPARKPKAAAVAPVDDLLDDWPDEDE